MGQDLVGLFRMVGKWLCFILIVDIFFIVFALNGVSVLGFLSEHIHPILPSKAVSEGKMDLK